MLEILIIVIGIWAYPFVGYFLVEKSIKQPSFWKPIWVTSTGLVLLAIFGLSTNISTTVSAIDWFIVSCFYLLLCLGIWSTQFKTKMLTKVLGRIAMVVVFGIGYLMGTIGLLGIGLVLGEFTVHAEKWLGNGLIYKETSLGNAISDHRGKRVEIYQTISWLPIFEWQKQEKRYNSVIAYANTLNVNYNPKENRIYLSASAPNRVDNKIEHWADTLDLNND